MILILDEPTNFLDLEHILWLKSFLVNYENAFILVSHDTTFLNEVTNVIYHIDSSVLTRYKGDFENFERMHALKRKQQEQAYDKQQKEIGKLEVFIAKNKARASTTNMAKSRQKKLDKMDLVEKITEKAKPSFSFRESRTPSRFIVETEQLVIGYDEGLTKPLDLRLERNQKIALMGVNGLGKSTLLRTLLGIIKPVSGKVILGDNLEPGYFEQESSDKNRKTALNELWDEFPGMTNREVRAALARAGLTNEHITSLMMVLSGGEATKVRLTKIMLREVNWLVLDEPTNHLDVEAKDELKKALKAYKGTILIVSHDPEFYEDFITDKWSAEDWTLKIV
jgi:ATPase subunit of ABC transporter with duplicated ATPase domains